MNTRLLMRASAVVLAVFGASGTFLPREILVRAGTSPAGFSVVLIQMAGALYLGFAMLNWMAQGSVMGGIYGRPVAVGNLAHFTIGALALLKVILSGQRSPEVVVGAAVYAILAVSFAVIAFGRAPRTRVEA
ncbi:MAG TPA: hypothetical protein VGI14_00530 [Casimicrobiaceae bacterium]|jgi:hypothetical protein